MTSPITPILKSIFFFRTLYSQIITVRFNSISRPLNEVDSEPSIIAALGQAPGSKSKFDELQDETKIIIIAVKIYFNIINFSQTLYQTIKKKRL